ncbi:hypothetical protein [Bacillus manliponensis]|uniref:hypothetical protein n=1 Tax=Bacillus manliponensis TaxID=574376 RepID=UPI0035140D88
MDRELLEDKKRTANNWWIISWSVLIFGWLLFMIQVISVPYFVSIFFGGFVICSFIAYLKE